MAGRDDSALFTGANSGSLIAPRANKLQEQRKLDKDARLELSQKLYPASEIIFDILEHEKKLVTLEIASMPITVSTTEENVKEVLMSLQRSLRMINRLHKKFERALAQPQLSAEEIDAILDGFEDDDEPQA
jgi:hypothetical protein